MSELKVTWLWNIRRSMFFIFPIAIELSELRASWQIKDYVVIVNVWLIQCYHIPNRKFSSLSRLALIHKSIKLQHSLSSESLKVR